MPEPINNNKNRKAMTEEAKNLATESAFPEVYTNGNDFITSTNGLSKRELFAAMAMQGFMNEPQPFESSIDDDIRLTAKLSVKYADALLEELCKIDKT